MKNYTSTIVIVACLALVGFLVHLHVDPAITLAITIVPTLIAYFTNSKSEPPAGTGIVFVAAAAAIVSSVLACGCSAAQKAAETDLITHTGDCVLECGIELAMSGQESQAPLVCGQRCLGHEVTDPTQLADIARIVAGTKTAGAQVAAAKRPDGGQ